MVKKIKIKYLEENGHSPFLTWMLHLKDGLAKGIILKRLNRIRQGNFGVTRSLGSGIHELKINYGPGYRLYFGYENQTVVILLMGGIKRSQFQDIYKAKDFWERYRSKYDQK
jgi:putative addiction module killer protein